MLSKRFIGCSYWSRINKKGPPLSISIEALKEGIEVIRQSIIEVIDS